MFAPVRPVSYTHLDVYKRQMLYRAETQYIKRRVAAFAKPVNYIYHIGQYLSLIHI